MGADTGEWKPDPTGKHKWRWQPRPGVWSAQVSDGDETSIDPLVPDLIASGPCPTCGNSRFEWKRDKLPFWLCLCLFWPALPFLPKKPYCTRCGKEWWEPVKRQ